jgi:hypothetical protein
MLRLLNRKILQKPRYAVAQFSSAGQKWRGVGAQTAQERP